MKVCVASEFNRFSEAPCRHGHVNGGCHIRFVCRPSGGLVEVLKEAPEHRVQAKTLVAERFAEEVAGFEPGREVVPGLGADRLPTDWGANHGWDRKLEHRQSEVLRYGCPDLRFHVPLEGGVSPPCVDLASTGIRGEERHHAYWPTAGRVQQFRRADRASRCLDRDLDVGLCEGKVRGCQHETVAGGDALVERRAFQQCTARKHEFHALRNVFDHPPYEVRPRAADAHFVRIVDDQQEREWRTLHRGVQCAPHVRRKVAGSVYGGRRAVAISADQSGSDLFREDLGCAARAIERDPMDGVVLGHLTGERYQEGGLAVARGSLEDSQASADILVKPLKKFASGHQVVSPPWHRVTVHALSSSRQVLCLPLASDPEMSLPLRVRPRLSRRSVPTSQDVTPPGGRPFRPLELGR